MPLILLYLYSRIKINSPDKQGQILLEDLWTIWSCCLYVFYEYYYHNIFLSMYGFIPV